ncbi:MAG: single-stranded-DNA-specific exonuclease RecJ [Gammaproteobacteria bacterium]|nr:single-stranded-DNA-specific exonuclease RecJ [Gammaproteobacteria bacterium]
MDTAAPARLAKTLRRRAVDAARADQLSGHPVLRRVYAARGVDAADELELGLAGLLPYSLLSGMDAAVDLLERALRDRQRMLIVGDFDADGATSTALACLVLRGLGAQVDYLVPNRFEYGYGLTPEIVEVAAGMHPDLLITVDNGISSLAGVAAAKALGMRVLVTDHHLPGAELPEADAIVNPNQPGCAFPSKALAGVGVMFYVLLALRARLRERGWFAENGLPEPNLAEYLDLVALGTVADVVPLDRNNRILVAQGLARIRAGRCRPGISALLSVGKRERARVGATDLGFTLGPRLNAAGRLDDMSAGIECLLCAHPDRALTMAAELDALNAERKDIESGMQAEAFAALDRVLPGLAGELPAGLALFERDWHQGVVGILAARVKDRYHRPTICFTEVGEGELKGSARSVPGVHIRDALDWVAARRPGLLTKFGGHAMAAGLSLREADLPAFRTAFAEAVLAQLDGRELVAEIWSDGELQAEELGIELAEILRAAGPWGQHFPEPTFDGQFLVRGQRVLADKHLKLQLAHPDTGLLLDAIAFNAAPEWLKGLPERVQLVYKLDVNEWRGERKLQLLVDYLAF